MGRAGEMKPRHLTISVVCALDLASLAAFCEGCSLAVQRLRAEGKLWAHLLSALVVKNDGGGWQPEQDRMVRRWQQTLRSGGKQVWSHEFADRFAALFKHDDQSLTLGRQVPLAKHEGAGDHARGGFDVADYRITPDGVLAGVFEVIYPYVFGVATIIEEINLLERDAQRALVNFILYFLTSPAEGGRLLSMVGPHDHQRIRVTEQWVANVVQVHSLIVIKEFVEEPAGTAIPLTRVAESPELAGILNRAPWYEKYGTRLIPRIKEMEIGYRADELYLVDRNATIVVGERFYANDTLVLYRHELLLAIIHLLSRLAFLSQFLRMLRGSAHLQPSRVTDPATTLQATLDARSVLVLIIESLEINSLIRHGFTRLYVDRLSREMAISTVVLGAERWLELAERVALPASIRSSQLSLDLESRNNRLQTVGIFVAAIALLVSVGLQVLQMVIAR
jgi:hypothetical protein